MGKSAFDFMLDARTWPLGGELVRAVRKAIRTGNLAGGVTDVRDLMQDPGGVTDSNELAFDQAIFDAVKEFIENTNFNPDLVAPHKY